MRHARRKPDSSGMIITAERIKALDDLGFDWNAQVQAPRSFEHRIEQLRAFKDVHGHFRVTPTLDTNLAAFVEP